MRNVKVLAFEQAGVPRMLSSDAEIEAAFARGDIDRDTAVTVYLATGERRYGPARSHTELAALLPAPEPYVPDEVPTPAVADEPAAAPPAPEPASAPGPALELAGAEISATRTPRAPLREAPGPGPRPVARSQRSVPVVPEGAQLWNWMMLPYRRYADFEGRSQRKEFWAFSLFLGGAVLLLAAMTGSGSSGATGLLAILLIASLVPALAVQVRRFHDLGVTGWFVLLPLIPWLGALVVLVAMLMPGTSGRNRYGDDPKGGAG